jgi:hypothetical protein
LHRHSLRKLQRSLDRLEARLFAKRVEERIGHQELEARVTQAHRGVEATYAKQAKDYTPLKLAQLICFLLSLEYTNIVLSIDAETGHGS